MPLDKNELRRALRERRRRFVREAGDRGRREELELAISERVLAHLGEARIVAAYLSNGHEVNILPSLGLLAGRGLVTALPHVTDSASGMRFLRWSPGEPLVDGPYGLLQPAATAAEVEPDLILAPLVGFDRKLRRLGQGAAFYDRAFARLPGARRIGIAWSVQEADELPAEAWDVPLHAIVTETEWIEPQS